MTSLTNRYRRALAAVPRLLKAGALANSEAGTGTPCGDSHISKDKVCHIGEPSAEPSKDTHTPIHLTLTRFNPKTMSEEVKIVHPNDFSEIGTRKEMGKKGLRVIIKHGGEVWSLKRDNNVDFFKNYDKVKKDAGVWWTHQEGEKWSDGASKTKIWRAMWKPKPITNSGTPCGDSFISPEKECHLATNSSAKIPEPPPGSETFSFDTSKWSKSHGGAQGVVKKLKVLEAKLKDGDYAGVLAYQYKHNSPAPNSYMKGHQAGVEKLHALAKEKMGAIAKETAPKADAIQDVSKWKKVGGQLGSNPGGQYEDENGNKWYVKESKSEDHAKNELLASKLYSIAGAPVTNVIPVMVNGKLGTASLWENPLVSFNPNMDKHAAVKNFAVHAWLGNWDAIGTGNDNQMWVAHGDGTALKTVDVGGSMLYRAQGTPKGAAWDEHASEWQTMRDPTKNSFAAAVFGGMTPKELDDSADRLQFVTDNQIRQMTMEDGPGTEKEREKLADTLIARRNAIMGYASHFKTQSGLDLAKPGSEQTVVTPVAPAPEPVKLPPPPKDEAPKLAEWDDVKPGYHDIKSGKDSATFHVDEVTKDEVKYTLVASTGSLGDSLPAPGQHGSFNEQQWKSLKEAEKNPVGFGTYQTPPDVDFTQQKPNLNIDLEPKPNLPKLPDDLFGPNDKPTAFPISKGYLKAIQDAAATGDVEKVKAVQAPAGVVKKVKAWHKEVVTSMSGATAQGAAFIPQEASSTQSNPSGVPIEPKYIKPGTNSLTVNKKLHEIATAAATNDVSKLEAVYTKADATQSYAKAAHAYKMGLIQQMKAGTVFGAVKPPPSGYAPPAGTTTSIAKAPPMPKAGFDASKVPQPPNFFAFGDTGKPLSSKPEFNKANQEEVNTIYGLGKTGSVKAVKDYAVKSPSTHVTAYKSVVVENIEQQLNPPKPIEYLKGAMADIANRALPKADFSVKYFNQDIGRYIVLGEAPEVDKDLANGWNKYSTDWHESSVKNVKAHRAAVDGIPATDWDKIHDYTVGGYKGMNDQIMGRKQNSDGVKAGIAVLKHAVEVPEGTWLSRKVHISATDVLSKIESSVGKVLQDTGMISSSVDHTVWSGNVQFKMRVGPGVRGLYVGPRSDGGRKSGSPSEKEVILPPNTRMVVTKVEKTGGTIHVVAYLLPTLKNQCCK